MLGATLASEVVAALAECLSKVLIGELSCCRQFLLKFFVVQGSKQEVTKIIPLCYMDEYPCVVKFLQIFSVDSASV